MIEDEETALSEITILPDGRVYVFGMSDKILEVVQILQHGDPRLEDLRSRLHNPEQWVDTACATGSSPGPDTKGTTD